MRAVFGRGFAPNPRGRLRGDPERPTPRPRAALCAAWPSRLLRVKYAVVTFGCRVNQADSSSIERQLRAAGGHATAVETADVVVVNTCSVTATADQGARQIIRRIARSNPAARIVATGCYATRAAEDFAALPNVVSVVTNDHKERLVSYVRETTERTTAERFGGGDGACGELVAPGTAGRTGYTLRVQTGCDETCAYCIIPSTRGRGRSVPLAAVLDEVDRVGAAGYREAALTGVHLGSYGRDLEPASSLIALLRALDRNPADLVFRISSLEPMDCTPAIVDLVATSDRFAPHFHLPLQHASDAVLGGMRRPYTREYYARLVDSIRTRLPHAGIGSDMIIGFPGETETDVETTLAYLAGSPLTYLHVFPYSDRPGTDATRMPAKVPGPEVRSRARAVREVGATLAARFRMSQVGTVRPALTLKDDHGALAVTDNYLKVRLGAEQVENQRVHVRITEAGERLTGVIEHPA